MSEVDIATCEDEDLLAEMIAKTSDITLRKEIRARQKELRESAATKVADRQKQRETLGTNLDSVKTRSMQADEEKMKKMKSYQEQSKMTIGAASTSDPVKAQKERAEHEKAAQLRQYDEMAKSGGAASYQGGLEKINQLELHHKEMGKERLLKQFDDMQKNYSKLG